MLHFSQKCHLNSLSLPDDMNFYYLDFNYFRHYIRIFLLLLAKKRLLMSGSIK